MTSTQAPTKDRIFKAAYEEFSKRGFAGARVDEIAAKAGANKALLYQHYGDKESLFRLVLEAKLQLLGELRADPDRFAEAAGDFFDFHAANPAVSRLLLFEALDFGAKGVPNESERKKHLLDHVAEIEELQRSGHVDPDLDARQTLVTLIGVVMVWFSLPPAVRMITGENPSTKEALAKRRAHVVEVARKILEVR
jgi:AcrR family transcriptional regulator